MSHRSGTKRFLAWCEHAPFDDLRLPERDTARTVINDMRALHKNFVLASFVVVMNIG